MGVKKFFSFFLSLVFCFSMMCIDAFGMDKNMGAPHHAGHLDQINEGEDHGEVQGGVNNEIHVEDHNEEVHDEDNDNNEEVHEVHNEGENEDVNSVKSFLGEHWVKILLAFAGIVVVSVGSAVVYFDRSRGKISSMKKGDFLKRVNRLSEKNPSIVSKTKKCISECEKIRNKLVKKSKKNYKVGDKKVMV